MDGESPAARGRDFERLTAGRAETLLMFVANRRYRKAKLPKLRDRNGNRVSLLLNMVRRLPAFQAHSAPNWKAIALRPAPCGKTLSSDRIGRLACSLESWDVLATMRAWRGSKVTKCNNTSRHPLMPVPRCDRSNTKSASLRHVEAAMPCAQYQPVEWQETDKSAGREAARAANNLLAYRRCIFPWSGVRHCESGEDFQIFLGPGPRTLCTFLWKSRDARRMPERKSLMARHLRPDFRYVLSQGN